MTLWAPPPFGTRWWKSQAGSSPEAPADASGDCAVWVENACAYPLSLLLRKSSGTKSFSENRRTLLFKRMCAGASECTCVKLASGDTLGTTAVLERPVAEKGARGDQRSLQVQEASGAKRRCDCEKQTCGGWGRANARCSELGRAGAWHAGRPSPGTGEQCGRLATCEPTL